MFSSSLKPLTPWEALHKIYEDLTISDMLWLVIAGLLIYFFYWLSTKQLRRKEKGPKEVLLWISILGGWIFCLVIFGLPRIRVGGASSFIFMACSSAVSLAAVLAFIKKDDDWIKVIYGTVVIFIGFSIAITFGLGAHETSYSIIFGFLAGVTIGMLIHSAKNMGKKQDDDEEQKDDAHDMSSEWDFPEKRNRNKKW